MEILSTAGKVILTLESDHLIEADLRGLDLRGADFTGVDISDVAFDGADLRAALFADVDGRRTSFRGADMRNCVIACSQFGAVTFAKAKLDRCHMRDVTTYNVDFSDVSFSKANLSNVHFSVGSFYDCNFTGARFHRLAFIQCLGLASSKGLTTIFHMGPSALDSVTLRENIVAMPDEFLLELGYSKQETETVKALYSSGIKFYSCFISYTRSEREIASMLQRDLIASGVSCWRDETDMRGGDYWRRQINEALRVYDKVLIICSRSSLRRSEVVEEIIEGIEQERASGRQKLFPITVDNYLFSKNARQNVMKLPQRQQREDWLTYLLNYHVPDFSMWKDREAYSCIFDRLLADLQADPTTDTSKPKKTGPFSSHPYLGYKLPPEQEAAFSRLPSAAKDKVNRVRKPKRNLK